MTKRFFIQALLVSSLALVAAGAGAQSIGGLTSGGGGGGDGGRGGFDLPGGRGGDGNGDGRQAHVDDSDEQLDVWVARCNEAGGGMVTADDGNYECHDSGGTPIEDW